MLRWFTTVFGNSTRLYLGTNGTGIKYINKDDIVGLDIENPPTLTGTLNDYLVPPYITGFNIRYIHCNDNYIGTVTEYGWDIIALGVKDLKQEIEAAGFIEAESIVTPVNQAIIARRPKTIR